MRKSKISFLRRATTSPLGKDVRRSSSFSTLVTRSSVHVSSERPAEARCCTSSTDSATVYSDGSVADSNSSCNSVHPNESLDGSTATILKKKSLLKKKGSKLRLRLHRSASFRREPVLDESVADLINAYLAALDYPEHLSKKVHRKLEKYVKSNGLKRKSLSPRNHTEYKSPDVEVPCTDTDITIQDALLLKHDEIKYYQDAGGLESIILRAIPQKNKVDCYWHLYGSSLCKSHLFYNSEGALRPKNFGGNSLCRTLSDPCVAIFLRSIASSFNREHVSPGKYLGMLPRGGVYVVRRGTARIMVKGKCVAELAAGSVFEADVFLKGHVTFCFENANSVNGERKCNGDYIYARSNVSILAGSPMPSSQYAYGCEFGVLPLDEFTSIISNDKLCPPPGMAIVRKNLKSFEDFCRIEMEKKNKEKQEYDSMIRAKVERESKKAANAQLVIACRDGCLDRVKEALNAGAGLDYAVDPEKERKIVHMCVDLERIHILEYILECDASLVNCKDSLGQTALHICCGKSHSDVVENILKLLMKKGAILTITDLNGNTPVHVLAAKGDLNFLFFFKKHIAEYLDNGSDLMKIKNKAEQSPIDICRTQQVRRVLKPKTSYGGNER